MYTELTDLRLLHGGLLARRFPGLKTLTNRTVPDATVPEELPAMMSAQDDDHSLEDDDDNPYLQGQAPGASLRQRHQTDNRLNPDFSAPTISGASREAPPPPKKKRRRLKRGALAVFVLALAALLLGALRWSGRWGDAAVLASGGGGGSGDGGAGRGGADSAQQWANERGEAQRKEELGAMAAEVGRVQARAAQAQAELEQQRAREAAAAAAAAAAQAAAKAAAALAKARAALDAACSGFDLLEPGTALQGFQRVTPFKSTSRGACCQSCLDDGALREGCGAMLYDGKRYNCFLFPTAQGYPRMRKKGMQAGVRRR
jgi:hypothetical protein